MPKKRTVIKRTFTSSAKNYDQIIFFVFLFVYFSNNEYRKQEQHWHGDDCSKQGEGIGLLLESLS
jgi:hypothetical protein